MKNVYVFFVLLLAVTAVTAQNVIRVGDEDLTGTSDVTWTKDNVYQLDGFVFLEEGGRLTIEAGTRIEGLTEDEKTTTDLASALIIARGAQIFANGTSAEPIVFASSDPFADYFDQGLWGGVIVLGNAVIGSNDSEGLIEGFETSETRALYGGDDDTDNSGVLRYVSIRNAGAERGGGDEINGLTLGGVGSATTVEYIEILANSDDGIEFFGGAVDVKYAAVAFCGDDAFDFDEGWRGRGQFWFSISLPTGAGDHGGEWDGAKPDDNPRYANPVISNVTFIGGGESSDAKNDHGILIRDGAAPELYNSIVTDFANFALQVEDRASGTDSRSYLESGELVLANNIWFGFGSGVNLTCDTLNSPILVATDDSPDFPECDWLVTHLADNGNTLENPMLNSISRVDDGGLDPRPSANSPAFSDVATLSDPWFSQVNFKGAFGYDNPWLEWTALNELGILAQEFVSTTDLETLGYELMAAPNPVRGATTIQFALPTATTATVQVFDMNGQLVANLLDQELRSAGPHNITFDASGLSAGLYFYNLTTAQGQMTRKLVVR